MPLERRPPLRTYLSTVADPEKLRTFYHGRSPSHVDDGGDLGPHMQLASLNVLDSIKAACDRVPTSAAPPHSRQLVKTAGARAQVADRVPLLEDPLLQPPPMRSSSSDSESVTTRAPSPQPPQPGSTAHQQDSVTYVVPLSPPNTSNGRSTSREPSAASTAATPADDELARSRKQLEELKARYEFERRAHLQQRARQLRAEAHQRQTEEDITEKVAQLLTEYESLVSSRDTVHKEHLEHVLQRVAEEWKRSARNLEETRAACESNFLTRLQTALVEEQHQLVARLQQHLAKIVQSTVDTETAQQTAIAAAVEEQVESFKEEYRHILEQDMQERQRLMDERVAHRESQWRAFLKEEHARMVAAGEAVAREGERRQRETLHIAMRDITELRQTLLQEGARRQAEVAREYLSAYQNLANDYVAATGEATAYVQQLQHEYAVLMRALHAEVNRVNAERQEATRRAEHGAVDVAEVVAQQVRVVEEQVEARWHGLFEKERESHCAALADLSKTHETALKRLRDRYTAADVALKRQHGDEMAQLQARLAELQAHRDASIDEAVCSLAEVAQNLEKEKNALITETLQLKEELRREALEHEVKLQEVRRGEEQRYAMQLRGLETVYDEVLQQYKEKINLAEAREDQGNGTMASTAVLQHLKEVEEELQEVRARQQQRIQQATDEVVTVWSERLESARRQHQADCGALEQQHRMLRQRLLDEVRERETVAEKMLFAAREAHQEELRESVQREKEAAQHAVNRLERQHASALTQLSEEAERRVRVAETIISEREHQLEDAQRTWQQRCDEAQKKMLDALLVQLASQHAQQLSELECREGTLRQSLAQLAQQRAEEAHTSRMQAQAAVETQVEKRLEQMQQSWLRLIEAELRGRFTMWQEAREHELGSILHAHRNEVGLVHQHYARHITALEEAMQAQCSREAGVKEAQISAWAAARTASLETYSAAAVARVQQLEAEEQAKWEAKFRQRTEQDAAVFEASTIRLTECLRTSEELRSRVEGEVRELYTAQLAQQNERWSSLLAEQRARHEEAIASVQAESSKLLAENAVARERALDARDEAHQAHVRDLVKLHEEQLDALRSRHAAALVEAREAAEKRCAQVQKQADEARASNDSAAVERLRAMEAASQQTIAALRELCDAQAAQLRDKEVEMQLQVMRLQQEQEMQLRGEYEASIVRLRDAVEAGNRSRAALEVSLLDRVQAEADQIQARSEQKYAELAKDLQRQVSARIAEHKAELAAQQDQRRKEMAQQQLNVEQALTTQATQLHEEYEAALATQRASFDDQLKAWKLLIEEERSGRRAAEERANDALTQTTRLQLTAEQQQVAAYRALEDHYRRIIDNIRDDIQEEREELARNALEEEEHRFVTAMLQRRQTHAHQFSPQRRGGPQEVAQPSRSPILPLTTGAVVTPSHHEVPLYPSSSQLRLNEVPLDNGVIATTHSSRTPALQVETQLLPPLCSLQRLRQLWDVLEVPSDDQTAFQEYVESLTATPAAQQDVVAREQQRLEAQLPLLEAFTRREYVQRQLRMMDSTSALSRGAFNASKGSASGVSGDGAVDIVEREVLADTTNGPHPVTVSALPSSPSSDPSRESEIEYLHGELQRLTAQLRRDVAKHEQQHGELFCYRGRRVMDAL